MNITVIQVYAPTSNSGDEEQLYHELCTAIEDAPKKDVLIVQGDWNAKVSTDAYDDYPGTVGKFGWAQQTNGEYECSSSHATTILQLLTLCKTISLQTN